LVDVWLDVEYGQYNTPISTITYNLRFKQMTGDTSDQHVLDANLEKLKKILEVYEARLSQCKYLAGDIISLADLSHFPYTYYLMETQHGSLFDSYPHVKAWWENMMARPSIKKVAQLMSTK
jgi:glutathione S-transferase